MKARRMTALILSVLMILGIFRISASAAQRTPFGYINEYEVAGDTVDSNFVAQHQEVLELLYNGCMEFQSSIDVSRYNLSTNDYVPLRNALIGIYPELFFVSNAGYSYSGSKIFKINPSYNVTKAQAEVMLAEFYSKADEYLALVDDSMDEFTKALILHDALVLNNRYEDVNSTNYTFMVEGWGRCENYAECYAYLLAQIGIESEIINSDDMVHEWMKIHLDGSDYYYNVDVTWDDPTTSQTENEDMPGRVSHSYFLLSDEAVDFGDHYNYEVIHASDDAYDNYVNLHSLENPIFYIDGALYTLYKEVNTDDYNHEVGYVAIYHPADDSFKNLVTVDEWWSAGGGYVWMQNYSGIGEYSGLLYFNDESTIYCYDPATGRCEEYISEADVSDIIGEGNHLYGMYIDGGKIYGRVSTSPNDAIVFIELGECLEPAADPKAGHSISLNGDIGLNFYYNLTDDEAAGQSVDFTWTVAGEDQSASCELKYDEKTGKYKASCPIPAAEMTAEVTATLAIGEEMITDSFSVVDYAGQILSGDYQTAYLTNHSQDEYDRLATLVKTMLYYGARAQEKFDRDTANLADDGIDYTPAQVDADAIVDTDPSDMSADLGNYGLKYKGTSLVFLSQSSLRHYYVITNSNNFASVKDSVTFGSDTPIEFGRKSARIYFELKDIAAADLDERYTIKIGTTEYAYSALDYVKGCLQSDSMDDEMKALAAATYLYNQAANAYFDQQA